MTATTCTIGPFSDGTRCGKPAVVTFTARGKEYAECADHAPRFALTEPVATVEVGTRVAVDHGGIRKVGRVVGVTPTRCRVEVPSRGSTKVITRRLVDVTVSA